MWTKLEGLRRLIDQVLEAKEYLAGKNISTQNVYRMCYLIAKLLLGDGLDPLEVRSRIFDWANDHGIFIEHSVNRIIDKAGNDKVLLRGSAPMWIGKSDVEEITKRFDAKLVRCDALAMLCYSKAYANKHGEFTIPYRSLHAWVGGGSLTSHKNAVRELIMFEYLESLSQQDNVRRWNKKQVADGVVYRLVVPISNQKDHLLNGNDIWGLYRSVFSGK